MELVGDIFLLDRISAKAVYCFMSLVVDGLSADALDLRRSAKSDQLEAKPVSPAYADGRI